MHILSKNNIEKNDSIIVLGAGPSITKYLKSVIEYQGLYNSTVISANYKHKTLKVDYTVFIDNKIWKIYRNKAKNSNIILGGGIPYKKYPSKNNCNLYLINHKDSPSYLNVKKIKIDDDGLINHQVGNAGFASILISTFFDPKTILLCGFDGPKGRDYKNFVKSGTTKIRKEKIVRNSKFLENLLLFLRKKDINIISFKNDRLWGVDKTKVGITSFDVSVF